MELLRAPLALEATKLMRPREFPLDTPKSKLKAPLAWAQCAADTVPLNDAHPKLEHTVALHDAQATKELGERYAEFGAQAENYMCSNFGIEDADKKHYMGRSQPPRFKRQQVVKEERLDEDGAHSEGARFWATIATRLRELEKAGEKQGFVLSERLRAPLGERPNELHRYP